MPMGFWSLNLKGDRVTAGTEILGKKRSSTDIRLRFYNLEFKVKSTTNIRPSNNSFEQIVPLALFWRY